MKFSVPAIFTTSGWVEIDADSLEDAKRKVEKLNERGVNYFDIQDSTSHSECIVEEIEELVGD
jgi:hypothetical protein